MAEAEGFIRLKRETIQRIRDRSVEKGDPLAMAVISGVLGAKSVPSLLPLCHQLRLQNVKISTEINEDDCSVRVSSLVIAEERTGVEMEALTAVAIALLNIWDLVKQYEKDEAGQYPATEIYGIRVTRKLKTPRGSAA